MAIIVHGLAQWLQGLSSPYWVEGPTVSRMQACKGCMLLKLGNPKAYVPI